MRSCSFCKKTYAAGTGVLFRMPKDSCRRERWSQVTGKTFAATNLICEDHFLPQQIIRSGNKKMLLPNAEPFVPSSQEDDSSGSDMSFSEHNNPHYYGNHSKHKMTTDRQYNLLKTNMAKFLQSNKNDCDNNSPNGIVKYKQNQLHWTQLTEKLNKLGPPYRTVQEWKKVWCDFKRSEKKRRAKLKPKPQATENEKNYDDEIFQTEIDDTATSSELNMHIKSENADNEQNSQSMLSSYSNDYSYPDDDDDDAPLSYIDDNLTLIPDESTGGSNAYQSRNSSELPTTRNNCGQLPNNKHYSTPPPPLQPANSPMLNQTLYTLQNQMEHQTKLLEHISQMSSTITGLIERQVDGVEKQTEAIRRQALATERHTSAMNKFIDMIREKMFKANSQKTESSADNSTDNIL